MEFFNKDSKLIQGRFEPTNLVQAVLADLIST